MLEVRHDACNSCWKLRLTAIHIVSAGSVTSGSLACSRGWRSPRRVEARRPAGAEELGPACPLWHPNAGNCATYTGQNVLVIIRARGRTVYACAQAHAVYAKLGFSASIPESRGRKRHVTQAQQTPISMLQHEHGLRATWLRGLQYVRSVDLRSACRHPLCEDVLHCVQGNIKALLQKRCLFVVGFVGQSESSSPSLGLCSSTHHHSILLRT